MKHVVIRLLNGDLVSLEFETKVVKLGEILKKIESVCSNNTRTFVPVCTDLHKGVTYSVEDQWVVLEDENEFSMVFVPTPPRAKTFYVCVAKGNSPSGEIPGCIWGDIALSLDIVEAIQKSIGQRMWIWDGQQWIEVKESYLPPQFQALIRHPTQDFQIPFGYWSFTGGALLEWFKPTTETRIEAISKFNYDQLSTSFTVDNVEYHVHFDFFPFHLRLDDDTKAVVAPHMVEYLSKAELYRFKPETSQSLLLDVFAIS